MTTVKSVVTVAFTYLLSRRRKPYLGITPTLRQRIPVFENNTQLLSSPTAAYHLSSKVPLSLGYRS